MPAQNESYIGIDEFLERYYLALKSGAWGSSFFWKRASEQPNDFLNWYLEHKGKISNQYLKVLYEEIAKAQQSSSNDAQNFLYTVQVLTAFDNDGTGRGVPEYALVQYTRIILKSISNGQIKNPMNTYNLLKHMYYKLLDYQLPNATLAREIALHPLATPNDVWEWLTRYSSYDFQGSVNAAKKKLNDLVAVTKKKLAEEFDSKKTTLPRIDKIDSLGISIIPSIADRIVEIVKYFAKNGLDGQTQEDVAKAQSIAAELRQEFNIANILDIGQKDYVQQYDTQAEAKIATLNVENQRLKEEVARLESLEEEYMAVNRELHESREEQSRLQTENEELESELRKAKTQNATLNAALNTYLETAGARVDGPIYGIRPDLRKELEILRHKIETGRGSI
jgi:hypothetical protein